ncbi:unnamed protein product, partial [marine sediment metagenome]
SGKFKNTPGSHHRMRRNKVDDDRTKLCSFGFHVGTAGYARGFYRGTSRLVLVKFNPRDAVSVYSDISANKIRVCEYEVVSEWNGVQLEEVCYDIDDGSKTVSPSKGEPKDAWFDNPTKQSEVCEDQFDEGDYEWWNGPDVVHHIREEE